MSNTVIKVENLSKQYRLGELGTGTISHDLNRWWHSVRGKEDPYLKIGETNDRSTKGNSEYVWALRDINFEVRQGEVLGIIGKNGAGKSTLLKLLSRVTSPTTGSIKAKGRIASLLEVGTGFHEELTGRENIFLNGAILGMTKAEIHSKLDEIIAFSGTERYIDTPVKRYSSGMRVRLAFAVAAHLDPEILIVDEVLAVGDAEFQKKAIGKMQDISHTGGRTVLFVSHNMGSLKALCSNAIVLDNGYIDYTGDIDSSIDTYLIKNKIQFKKDKLKQLSDRTGTLEVLFNDFWIENLRGEVVQNLLTGESYSFCFNLKIIEPCNAIDIGFSIQTTTGETLGVLYSSYYHMFYKAEEKGSVIFKCIIPKVNIASGNYYIHGRILANGIEADWPKFPLGVITIDKGDFYYTGHLGFNGKAPLLIEGKWL